MHQRLLQLWGSVRIRCCLTQLHTIALLNTTTLSSLPATFLTEGSPLLRSLTGSREPHGNVDRHRLTDSGTLFNSNNTYLISTHTHAHTHTPTGASYYIILTAFDVESIGHLLCVRVPVRRRHWDITPTMHYAVHLSRVCRFFFVRSVHLASTIH